MTADWLPFAVLLALFCTLFLPVVLSGAGGTSEHADALGYHLPIITQMKADWPNVDIVHYESATSPGFHLLMATVWHLTGEPRAMLALNSLFGVLLISAVYFATRRFAGAWGAFALTMPLACSPYILGASIWLTTDNAALFFVTIALGSATIARTTNSRLIVGGLAAAAAVSIRQIHVWLAAPLGFAGLIASPLAMLVPTALRWHSNDPHAPPRSWRGLLAGCLAAALPATALLFFAWKWDWQLMPHATTPEILKHNTGPNPASPAFALALTGALGVFFLPFAWQSIRRLRINDPIVWLVALAALIAAVLPETSYLWTETFMPRAYGWLWRIVEKLPTIRERSIVITAAAPFGALVLLMLYRAASDAGHRVQAAVLLLSLLGWLGAQSMNSQAWQRYYEPIITLALIWLSAMSFPSSPGPNSGGGGGVEPARRGGSLRVTEGALSSSPGPTGGGGRVFEAGGGSRATDPSSGQCAAPDGVPRPAAAGRADRPDPRLLAPLTLALFQLALCAITLYKEVLADLQNH